MTITKEQTAMVDAELIATWREILKNRFSYQKDTVDELCDLALVGLAVQPRPISEAPKDGTVLILVWGDERVMGGWHEGSNDWCVSLPPPDELNDGATPWVAADNRTFNPTHFIPLSVLPKVQP
jgi:hypothetical protein